MSKIVSIDYNKIYPDDEGVVCYGCGQVIYEYKYGITEEGNMPFCLECCNNA